MEEDIFTLIRARFDHVLLAFIIIVCIIATLYVNLIMGIDVVYTHLFYIPIILAGIWYYRKAVYLALFLGLAHISIGYYIAGYIVPSTIVRAVLFIAVALVIGSLSKGKDKLYNGLRLLLESTDEGIYGVDVRGQCTFINQSALTMLGYSRDEIMGADMHSLIHHTKRDGTPCTREECCVDRSLKAGIGCRDSTDIFWKKDGSFFPVEYSSFPIVVNSKATGAVVTFIDITARKKAEEELRDARERAEFYVDLMGHDISNMNQSGLGCLELALDEPGLGVAGRDLLLKAIDALCNSSQLIDTVRKLQMVTDGKVRHERIDMCRMLQEVISQCSLVPGRKVAINFEQAHGCFVMADELLRDVFTNIIGNAIKHSTGLLIIDIDLDQVSEGGKDYYRVAIGDNGPGIRDELKKKLFNRMQRGETKATGRGLGLYLVKNIVDSFHGKVWVEDRVSGDYTKGSRFVVMLPAAEK